MNTIIARNMAFVLMPLAVLAIVALCVSPASAELIHHWKMDENTGTTAADDVGTRDGTLASADSGGYPTWVPAGGKIDGALDFESDHDPWTEGQYVDLGAGPVGVDYANNDYDFTVMGWVKGESFNHAGNYNLLFSENNSGDGSWMVGARERAAADDKSVMFAYQKGNASFVYGKTVLNTDQWYHMAFVNGASNLAVLYLDGEEEVYTTAWNDFDISGCRTTIGADAHDGTSLNSFWDGLIDDVRVYDEALTPAQIQAIVPEPSTLALLCIGMVMVLGCRYRRS